MEETLRSRLTWLRSQVLAEFQELNTDPLTLLYKRYPEHGKSDLEGCHLMSLQEKKLDAIVDGLATL